MHGGPLGRFKVTGRDAKNGLYIPRVFHADLNMRPFEEAGRLINGSAFHEDTSNGFKWPLFVTIIDKVNVIDYRAVQSAQYEVRAAFFLRHMPVADCHVVLHGG